LSSCFANVSLGKPYFIERRSDTLFLGSMATWSVITTIIEIKSVDHLCNAEVRSLFDGSTVHLRFTEVTPVDRIVCVPGIIKFIGVDQDEASTNRVGKCFYSFAFFRRKAR